MTRTDPVPELATATVSDGAPSARNLLVTVFGDALLPHGDGIAVQVRTLARLLESFAVSERLVRTSLTRLVNDRLLAVRSEGRRSSYHVDPRSLELFHRADDRIYRVATSAWDGSWTIVVVDGAEATPARRARLRQELTWAGLGVVAPNVLASPVVTAPEAAAIVGRVGGFDHVLVSRSRVVEAEGTLGGEALLRRCAPIEELSARYRSFVERFEPVLDADVEALAAEPAFKLRTLVVAEFRRLVLADPLLPFELLPDDWAGATARNVAARLYAAVAEPSERFLSGITGLDPIEGIATRFTT